MFDDDFERVEGTLGTWAPEPQPLRISSGGTHPFQMTIYPTTVSVVDKVGRSWVVRNVDLRPEDQVFFDSYSGRPVGFKVIRGDETIIYEFEPES
ncbi:hypothetical protein IU449_27050 [Nocardia higoensis]|uniref:Uncharacterized protein n=1 Tax=Nocardia higoensis TaxID=228599 RepID=A0ABS0DI99_9NOCA|nr:hypothetical protein [Nocardia higoensis]MBF6358159.1 hypothetical protein [Nocardia higoensis]